VCRNSYLCVFYRRGVLLRPTDTPTQLPTRRARPDCSSRIFSSRLRWCSERAGSDSESGESESRERIQSGAERREERQQLTAASATSAAATRGQRARRRPRARRAGHRRLRRARLVNSSDGASGDPRRGRGERQRTGESESECGAAQTAGRATASDCCKRDGVVVVVLLLLLAHTARDREIERTRRRGAHENKRRTDRPTQRILYQTRIRAAYSNCETTFFSRHVDADLHRPKSSAETARSGTSRFLTAELVSSFRSGTNIYSLTVSPDRTAVPVA
jgi:hypothetical protein